MLWIPRICLVRLQVIVANCFCCCLDVYKFDPEFEKNEATYDEIRREIIGDPDDTSDEEDEDEENEGEESAGMFILLWLQL